MGRFDFSDLLLDSVKETLVHIRMKDSEDQNSAARQLSIHAAGKSFSDQMEADSGFLIF